MKIHPLRHKGGFTLVELLVVISIIAVLAAAGFSAGLAAIQKAKRTTCLATCTSIEAAVNNFYTEYGSLPKSNLTKDTEKVDTKADLDFVKVLLGTETVASPLNTRAIKFLSVRDGKYISAARGLNGLVYNTTGTTVIGIFDPWGGTYKVLLDGNYDEILQAKTDSTDATTTVINGRKAAVYSDGADGISAGGKSADDVKTW